MKLSLLQSFKKSWFSKWIKYLVIVVLSVLFLFFCFLFVGWGKEAEKIDWGVNFSQKHARDLGLDWQKTYLALIEDLGVKKIKLGTHWDLLEPSQGEYDFTDLDWLIERAEEMELEIILVIGMKTPRWPECHIPDWANELSKKDQQERILIFLEKIVKKYKDKKSILFWQVENEPFFPFGACPWTDKDFFKKEIAFVREKDDSKRPIIVSDSGEWSFWFRSARLGDIVATTMYRTVWINEINSYVKYPLPPVFYRRKAWMINKIFNKEVICGELQAEPWGPSLLYDSPLEEQEKTMNLDIFIESIDFAKKTGIKEFYLWGAEWWYWMKTEQDDLDIWEEAKELFKD